MLPAGEHLDRVREALVPKRVLVVVHPDLRAGLDPLRPCPKVGQVVAPAEESGRQREQVQRQARGHAAADRESMASPRPLPAARMISLETEQHE